MVKRPKTPNPATGIGLCSSKAIEKGEMFCCYYTSSVCADQTKKLQKMKTYGEEVMQGIAESFRKWSNELLKKEIDKNGIENELWTVAVPFYALQYTNDARRLPGDTTLETETLKKRKKNSVQILPTRCSS